MKTHAGADAVTFSCLSVSYLRLVIFYLATLKAFVPSACLDICLETSAILYILQNMTGYPH
jgi:hypothetical protein